MHQSFSINCLAMSKLSITLFGNLRVELAGKPIPSFGTEKTRALLAYLVIESSRPVSRQFLAGMLWPDQTEKQAQHNFRQALLTLRKLLPDEEDTPAFILAVGDTIQFNPDSNFSSDYHRFHQHLDQGLSPAGGRINVPLVYAALDLYQEALLGQFELDDSNIFFEWLLLEQENCNRRAIQALVRLVSYHERRQELNLACQAASRLSLLTPWDEGAHLLVIRLMAQNGELSLALARFQSMQRQLNDLLDTPPSDQAFVLQEKIRQATSGKQVFNPQFSPPAHNICLPGTPFLGRQSELQAIHNLLADEHTRLLTLLGVGGVGKSRLALQIAHDQIGLFEDGVWQIALHEKALLPGILEVLQIHLNEEMTARDQTAQFLRTRKLLLLLDGFEHVQDQATTLANLLNAAPGLVVLVTSRQRLNLQNEHVFPLKGLEIPPADIRTLHEAQKYSAAALFMVHAARLHPQQVWRAADYEAMAKICCLLNGLPLGLELAAAASWSSTVEDIAEELSRNLDFIESRCADASPRHRSLRAVFNYSWETLNQAQQNVLTALAVFQGSFRLADAAAVTQSPAAVLLELLDRSLLHKDEYGRLAIPEPISPYVLELFSQSPESASRVYQQHAEYYTALFEKNASQLADSQITKAMQVLVPELGNSTRAWLWAINQRAIHLLNRLLQPLHALLHTRSEFTRSIDLLEMVVPLDIAGVEAQQLLARTHICLGMDYLRLGWSARAERILIIGLQSARVFNLQSDVIVALDALATCYHKQARQDEARQLAQEVLTLAEQHSDFLAQKNALFLLAEIEFRLGHLAAAETLMKDCLLAARKSGNPLALMAPLNSLGDYACYGENYEIALANFTECLKISRTFGSQLHQAIHLNNIGTVQHMRQNFPEALESYQSSLATCRKIGYLEGEALALGNIGEIKVQQSAFGEAIQYFESALDIARQIENPRNIAVALNNLGETYRLMKRADKARHYFSKGLQVAWKSRVISQTLEALTGLGMIMLENGDAVLARKCLELVSSHPSTEPDDRIRAQQALGAVGQETGPSASLEEVVKALQVNED